MATVGEVTPLGLWFLVLTMLLLLNTLGLGLLVSTIARNQQQAMMGSAFALMLPQIYLSGLIFPIANMPEVIQYATYAIPLRYYATILRGIFLKGVGIDVLFLQHALERYACRLGVIYNQCKPVCHVYTNSADSVAATIPQSYCRVRPCRRRDPGVISRCCACRWRWR